MTKEDNGKFIKFNDGTELYTRIINVSDKSIRTEIGPYNREDLCFMFKPRNPNGTHAGIPKGDLHFKISKVRFSEKVNSTKVINGTFPYGKYSLTRRTRMLAIEKLAKASADHGVTEEWIIKHLHKWVESGNRHALEALKALARVSGIELNQQKIENNNNVALFAQFNQLNTIQDDRRNRIDIPTSNGLKEIVDTVKAEVIKDE